MRKISLKALPVVLTTISVMMAIDLYLPAIPDLPQQLNGTAVEAQYTLGAFLVSFALGQLGFGMIADRANRRWLLTGSLVGLGIASLGAALVDTMTQLIVVRFLQGAAASAGVALVPVLLRELGDDITVIRLIGVINTIESIVPAFAPAVGAWLLTRTSWRGSFVAVAAMTVIAIVMFQILPPAENKSEKIGEPLLASYRALLTSRRFLGYCLSQALGIGALDTFILAAPYVITAHLNGTIEQFALMQLVLVVCYVIAANLAANVVERIGANETIVLGTVLAAGGALALLALFATLGTPSVVMMSAAMVFLYVGMALRGSPAFTLAMSVVPQYPGAAGALMIFVAVAASATGTPAVAPFLPGGTLALGVAVAVQALGAVALLPLIFAKRETAPA